METLAQFKKSTGVENIQLMQGKGRKFATLPGGTKLFVGNTTNLGETLFVIVNDGSTNPALKDSLWLVNSQAKLADLI